MIQIAEFIVNLFVFGLSLIFIAVGIFLLWVVGGEILREFNIRRRNKVDGYE
tara:strand:+ start:1111 stop:1266 length:156 start_codon:yes stop_codon:yes gene_type:complete